MTTTNPNPQASGTQPLPNSATADAAAQSTKPDFDTMAQAIVDNSTEQFSAAAANAPEEAPQEQWDAFTNQPRPVNEGNAHERIIRNAGQAMVAEQSAAAEAAEQAAALATPSADILTKMHAITPSDTVPENPQTQAS